MRINRYIVDICGVDLIGVYMHSIHSISEFIFRFFLSLEYKLLMHSYYNLTKKNSI